ncbi:putative quinol monooxygenase [Asinibacterium sp. OR53]|uniref:putative quinol monooxygenase n=1 Tax=Asinibacterium sp. OR53 TaxID=925409 RepID=UPI00047BA6B1|nr:putative quinol monooxygenase [Asinibacterium sp. OR53]
MTINTITHTHRNIRRWYCLLTAVCMLTVFSYTTVSAQKKDRMMRLAKIVVDSTQLENYRAALKEGIEAAVRLEPGVLTLYAVYDKNNPTHVTVLEIYANEEAYKAHLQTAHFKKYKSATQKMVVSLELTDVVPIGLETKPLVP